MLDTLFFAGQAYVASELARSAPIVDAQGRTYQGTWVNTSIAVNAYPPVGGHFRQLSAGALSGANVMAYDQLDADWDARNGIPATSCVATDARYSAVLRYGNTIDETAINTCVINWISVVYTRTRKKLPAT